MLTMFDLKIAMCDVFCLARNKKLNIYYKKLKIDFLKKETIVKTLRFTTMLKLFKFSQFDSVKLLIIVYLKLLNNIVVLILTKIKYVK